MTTADRLPTDRCGCPDPAEVFDRGHACGYSDAQDATRNIAHVGDHNPYRAAGHAETTAEQCEPRLSDHGQDKHCRACGTEHRAEATTATDEAAAGIDRAEVRRVLENEFWPFLAHDPHDPDRFWGLAVDAVMGLLATARTRPTETEWGVRGAGVTLRYGSERDAREQLLRSADHVLIRREVTAWTEADR